MTTNDGIIGWDFTNVLERQHHELTTTTSLKVNGYETGVGLAQVGIPGVAGNSQTLITLVALRSGTVNVA